MADIVYPGEQPGGTLGTGLMPANYDLVIYRGDYFPLEVTLRNPDGTPLDVTGYTARASIRVNYDDPAAPYEFTVTVGGTNGLIRLVLPSAVSTSIPAGDYIWDFQVTEPDGVNTRTYMAGDVRVVDEVTR